MTGYSYIGVRETSKGKWENLGAYTTDNINVPYDEAVSIYGKENVEVFTDPKTFDWLNQVRMVGQVKTLGHKIKKGFGIGVEKLEAIETQAKISRAHTPTAKVFDRPARPLRQKVFTQQPRPRPTAKPTMEPPKPYTSGGMMPPPSQYAKAQQNHPQEQPQQKHFTKWGRPLKPTNVFRDCRFTAPYIIRQQRQAMASNRRYNRRR